MRRVKLMIAAGAVVFFVSSAKAQTDRDNAMSVCKAGVEKDNKFDPQKDRVRMEALIGLCAMVLESQAQDRKRLADRAGVVPKIMMDRCRRAGDKELSDDEVLSCLNITLMMASEAALKNLHYFEMVKNGKTVRRYWTAQDCHQDLETGSVCVGQ